MREGTADRELEDALQDVGRRLAYPSRDLWPGVRARIAEPRRSTWVIGWRRLLPAAVTLVVILVALFALTPDVVARAEEILGLRGVQIFRVPETPSPVPTTRETATPLITGRSVGTLDEASALAGFPVLAPAALGDPDRILVDAAAGASVRVTLVYDSRPGIPVSPQAGVSALVVVLKGSIEPGVLGKAIGPGTTLENVTVNGGRGVWLAGQPHQVFYLDARGSFQQETLRLAGNTLLWEQGGVTYRLEADVSKDEALRIAASLR